MVERVSRLGVVIWVSAVQQTVMIWCEDGKDLAVARGNVANAARHALPDVGDLVEVSVNVFGKLRDCASLRIVDRAYFPGVAETLLQSA